MLSFGKRKSTRENKRLKNIKRIVLVSKGKSPSMLLRKRGMGQNMLNIEIEQ